MSADAPRVDRTSFVPVDPPDTLTAYFCPACGRQIVGSYNLEPARRSCTKTWHLAEPVAVKFVRGTG